LCTSPLRFLFLRCVEGAKCCAMTSPRKKSWHSTAPTTHR
jgi:hypothetical protein